MTNSFKRRVIRIFNNLKQEKKDTSASPIVPVYDKGKFIAYFRAISVSSLTNPDEIKNLASWREKHNWWFPAQFKITLAGTKKWLENQVLKTDDRFLFFLETPSGIAFGHMGFYRFNFLKHSCEVDNIVRGLDLLPGAMTPSLKTLINWAFNVLAVKTIYLTCYLDNQRAIVLYNRCGFKEVEKIPLKKIEENNMTRWEEDRDLGKAERYNLRMILKRPNV